ncbi:NAD(P)H-dependent oxidoreductase [Paenibacillus sp. GSMTC-2017]|uniref:NADPH-dependent FMN reductase n=1 Tax=Paenibacillus sp. GSMTC-2017 TaxID=2794350 RepID=UPI0018D96185|nr:NAD(P)H-dependent oxidoreductase [Paenibacillus sp. GSMTC-2017]MBH5318737.1 NAD(P)H-dependent oxidoreductase [Paenibacillus sp. GSMTC-2017]
MSQNVLFISGSPRAAANTKAVVNVVYRLLRDKQGNAQLLDLHRHVLPLFNGEPTQNELDSVIQLRKLVQEADAFFIVTPEYHNGISGALKNALDFLNGDHFRNKPVAIAAAAGGGKGGINALNNLRIVLRGVQANVLPSQYVADPNQIDSHGIFIDEAGVNALQSLVQDLISAIKVKEGV